MQLPLIAITLSMLAFVEAAPARAAGVTYAYDGQGRVTLATYQNGTTITYTYDTAGNLTSQTTQCGPSGC